MIVAVEGDTDLPFVRKLASDARIEISTEIDCSGKSRLDADLRGFNSAAQGSPWFVLRDLNSDARCAPEFLRANAMSHSEWMCYRVAVRELESWVLADSHGFSDFFAVEEDAIPAEPDLEIDPTLTIVQLCLASGSKQVRNAMVPMPGAAVSVGPLYEAKLIEFGERRWSVRRAAKNSESLRGARRALRDLAARWSRHIRGQAAD